MSKNKEPVILSNSKISSTYVTLDTIHTPLTLSNNRNEQIYVDTYRVADVNINVCNLKHEYATEQFIYRITGVCCNVYDNTLVRACICLTKQVCCYAWTERKQNFIILPDSRLLPANVYWITVFELVYKLKYPQSNNSNKCFVYALNCMLKSGMSTLDDYISANKSQSIQHRLLYMYSLHAISRCLGSNILQIPESVRRYYKIFGKRLKRKYKKEQMPGGHVFHLPKPISEHAIAEEYANEICKCIKLNPPIEAKDVAKCNTKRKNPKAQFADIRKMSDNIGTTYLCMYLYRCGEPARCGNIYSNPWVFVKNHMLQLGGGAVLRTVQIYLESEFLIEETVVENTIRLLFILYHECAHLYHWRAKQRYGYMSSEEAHYVKNRGATYEHHAHKFAIWCLIMDEVPIELIINMLFGLNDKRQHHSHKVALRYSRWLAYLNNKYGKLHIPADLGYIFINHEKRCLYKPNEEIVIK